MIRIIKSTVWTYFLCDTGEELDTVKEKLTFDQIIPAYKARHAKRKKKNYLFRMHDNKMVVFSGLTERIVKVCEDAEIEFQLENRSEKLEPILSPQYTEIISRLRSYQIDALEALEKANGGILWMATNAGKTEVAGALLHLFSESRVLYLVHRKELLTQTIARFKDKFGIEAGELSSEKMEVDKRVVVAMINTAYSRRDRLSKKFGYFDMVVMDECQHAAGKMASTVISLCTSAAFRVGLTGTLPQDLYKKLSVIRLFGDVQYRITNDTMIKDGWSSPAKVLMVQGSWGTSVAETIKQAFATELRNQHLAWKKRVKVSLWHDVYQEAFVHNEKRNEAIATTTASCAGDGVLIFVEYVEHGSILAEQTGLPFVSAGSADREEKFNQFKQGSIRGLITSPILEEGVDISRIRYLIMAGGKKSEIKLLQRVGRGLRKDKKKKKVTIIDFFDDEVPMLRKHTEERLKVYTAEGFPIEKVTLTEVKTRKL